MINLHFYSLRRFVLALVMIVCSLSAVSEVLAQKANVAIDPLTPATIKGRIFEEESGESMPYTNVFIAGTNQGTMAFTDGFYIMRGLRPGTYTIKASYISYDIGTQTVTLGPGEVFNLDFHLIVNAIMTEAYDVMGERALVEIDRTGSAHFISSKQMEAMPLDQVVDMIAQQPGVTLQDNEIHIRGGRADDTMFVVDGMNASDPLSGGGYGHQIDPSIIDEIEVLTGGFNAEYGQAVSGVINVTTKEGSERVEGSASFKRDYLFSTIPKNDSRGYRDLTNFTESNNIDIVKFSLSGPDPISGGLRALGLGLPGEQFMLTSLSMDIRDGYLPIYSRQNSLESPIHTGDIWSPRQQNNWNGLLKWTWRMTPSHKLSINNSRQMSVSGGFRLPGEGYSRSFIDNMDNALVYTTENILNQVYYRQVLSESDWFELIVGRNFNRMHANVNGNDDFTTYERAYYSPETGLAMGSEDRWHDHYSESYTFKGAYSFMGAGNNKFKTGLDLSFTEMQLIDLQTALGNPPEGKLGVKEDIFVAHPITSAAYFQDTLEFRGLIVNAGLRADIWAPGREVEMVMDNPDDYLFITHDMATEFDDDTFGLAGRRWKMRVSPRIGLSFPVTEKDKFSFNYGHFSQWPRFSYVYPQLVAQTATEVQLLGNPNLDPKVTVEYQTGLQHEFDGLWSLGVTFFNKDIYDYAKSVKMGTVDIGADETPDPDDYGTVTIQPVRYFNGDSARSLGVEVSVIKRTTKWLSGSASIEFQNTTGTNSQADEAYLQAIYNEAYAPTASIGGLTRSPLLWDKPWTVSMNLDFSVFEDDIPVIFGWRTPPNWSVNLLVRSEAGQRYTPRTYEGQGEYLYGDSNSETGPFKSYVNVRLNKYWKLGRGKKLTFYIEARNLLNHLNYRRVNSWTGEGYEIGNFDANYVERNDASTDTENYAKGVVDPSYIENPRIVLWGVSYSW